MKEFKFALGQILVIKCSGEYGEVIARAEYAHSEDCYLLRYKSANGRGFEDWWGVSALESKKTE